MKSTEQTELDGKFSKAKKNLISCIFSFSQFSSTLCWWLVWSHCVMFGWDTNDCIMTVYPRVLGPRHINTGKAAASCPRPNPSQWELC